jgi:hypothetical protein
MEQVEHTQHRGPLHGGIKKSNNMKITIAIVAAVIIIVVGGIIAYALKSGGSSTSSVIKTNEYQAVFFTNGQVYFGKLATLNSDYFKLTDIYYLQADSSDTNSSKNPQETNTDQNANVQLIKLGNEIHGPEDEMVVSKDQVLFFENLKSGGKVTKSIDQYQSQNK